MMFKFTGIGGFSLGIFLYLFKDIIKKNIFPKFKDENLSYRLLRLITFAIWSITVISVIIYAIIYKDKQTSEISRIAAPSKTLIQSQIPSLSGLDEIKKRGKIIIGIRSNLMPTQYKEGNYWKGLDGELSYRFAEFLNSNGIYVDEVPQFIIMNNPQERERYLKNKTVDIVISSYSQTPERINQGILFSQPYLENVGKGILVRKEDKNKKFTDSQDLNKKEFTIGYPKNTTAKEFCEKFMVNAKIIAYPDREDAYLDLKQGKIDAFVSDIIYLWYQAYINKGLAVLAEPVSYSSYSIGTKQKDILNIANEFILQKKKDGTLKELIDKYVSKYKNESEKSNIVENYEDTQKKYDQYIIEKGDTLSDIAFKKLGKPERYFEIMKINNIKDTILKQGAILMIPKK